eukprot:g46151.t1
MTCSWYILHIYMPSVFPKMTMNTGIREFGREAHPLKDSVLSPCPEGEQKIEAKEEEDRSRACHTLFPESLKQRLQGQKDDGRALRRLADVDINVAYIFSSRSFALFAPMVANFYCICALNSKKKNAHRVRSSARSDATSRGQICSRGELRKLSLRG